MAAIDAWWEEFAQWHFGKFPALPTFREDPDFWNELRHSVIRSGCDDIRMAEDASFRTAPDLVPTKHIAAFLGHITALFREADLAKKGLGPGSRSLAQAQSASCEDCYGHGFAFRYRHRSAPDANGNVEGTDELKGARVVFYCTCSMGAWLEEHHRSQEKSREVHSKIPRLADHPFLQLHKVSPGRGMAFMDNRYKYPPNGLPLWFGGTAMPDDLQKRARTAKKKPAGASHANDPHQPAKASVASQALYPNAEASGRDAAKQQMDLPGCQKATAPTETLPIPQDGGRP